MKNFLQRFFRGNAPRAAAFALWAGTLLAAVSACSYSLGNRGELPFSTIEIAPIVNEADLPQAQAPEKSRTR